MVPPIPEVIRRKRDGHRLSPQEIYFFVESVVNRTIDDSQSGAMLMAMFLNKLTIEETISLTKAMIETGEVLQFGRIQKKDLVDKHSTGGVGDKVSLVLTPALAACGLKVPMISGRGLGYTGGTLDKLESICGFQVALDAEQMRGALDASGCFICGATDNLAPADKIFYKIRDVTSTVEDPCLIAASILSKKAAEGIGTLAMDVKFGKGSTFQTEEEAKEMAELLKTVGKHLDLNMRVVLSEMNTPLGRFVGNALEVVESVMCMKNEIKNPLTALVKTLGGVILESQGMAKTVEKGEKMLGQTLENGAALDCFFKMLVCQGVSPEAAQALCSGDYWKVLPKAPYITLFRSSKTGVVACIDASDIAKSCWHLGAGRIKADSDVDHSVGVVLLKTTGELVTEGEPWIEVHHATETISPEVETLIQRSLSVVEESDWDGDFKFKMILI